MAVSFRKQVVSWMLGAFLGMAVILAAVYVIVVPMVNRLVEEVEAQRAKLTTLDNNLENIRTALGDSQLLLTEIDSQIQSWKTEVGPLLNDPSLSSDMRNALERLRNLSPEDRHFMQLASRDLPQIKDDLRAAVSVPPREAGVILLSGVVPASRWQERETPEGRGGFEAFVDITFPGNDTPFKSTPLIFTSLGGNGYQMRVLGINSIYPYRDDDALGLTRGFRVYINSQIVGNDSIIEMIRDNNWQLQWIALGKPSVADPKTE